MNQLIEENPIAARLAHYVLDSVIALQHLKSDSELSKLLMLAPSSISKIRHRHAQLTAGVMLRMHEAFGIPIAELKRLQAHQCMLDKRVRGT